MARPALPPGERPPLGDGVGADAEEVVEDCSIEGLVVLAALSFEVMAALCKFGAEVFLRLFAVLWASAFLDELIAVFVGFEFLVLVAGDDVVVSPFEVASVDAAAASASDDEDAASAAACDEEDAAAAAAAFCC